MGAGLCGRRERRRLLLLLVPLLRLHDKSAGAHLLHSQFSFNQMATVAFEAIINLKSGASAVAIILCWLASGRAGRDKKEKRHLVWLELELSLRIQSSRPPLPSPYERHIMKHLSFRFISLSSSFIFRSFWASTCCFGEAQTLIITRRRRAGRPLQLWPPSCP